MPKPSGSKVVHPARLPRMRWANGGGATREIGIGFRDAPHTAGYAWRLSLAELTQAADFSSLPGIDRIFTLASPGPLTLSINGVQRTLELGQAVEFTGEAKVQVALLTAGPQLGLNLMTHRSISAGAVLTARRNGRLQLDPRAGVVAATVLAGRATLTGDRRLTDLATLILGSEAEELHAEDCLLAVTTIHSD